jgi:hypothetical protein
MITDLKEGMLEADLTPDPAKPENDPDTLAKHVPFELQTIFANLQESARRYFKPDGFIKKFQFYGEPVRTS